MSWDQPSSSSWNNRRNSRSMSEDGEEKEEPATTARPIDEEGEIHSPHNNHSSSFGDFSRNGDRHHNHNRNGGFRGGNNHGGGGRFGGGPRRGGGNFHNQQRQGSFGSNDPRSTGGPPPRRDWDGPPPRDGGNAPPPSLSRASSRDFRNESGGGLPPRGNFRDTSSGSMDGGGPPFRDGPPGRGGDSFRENSSFRGDGPPRGDRGDGPPPFRDGQRGDRPPFRDGPPNRDGSFSRESSFSSLGKNRESSFGSVDRGLPSFSREGGGRDSFNSGGGPRPDLSRSSGGPPYESRGGGPPSRDGGANIPPTFLRRGSSRDTSFGDASMGPAHAGGGPPLLDQDQGRNTIIPVQQHAPVNPGGVPPPGGVARPTDPRRRPSKEATGLDLPHGSVPPAGGTFQEIGPPGQARRMGSYSSLADSASSLGHDGQERGPSGNYRSPVQRRSLNDLSRANSGGPDRGEYFGGGPAPSRNSWSTPSGNERPRLPNPNNGPGSPNSRLPPLAPSMSGGNNQHNSIFRQHDQRPPRGPPDFNGPIPRGSPLRRNMGAPDGGPAFGNRAPSTPRMSPSKTIPLKSNVGQLGRNEVTTPKPKGQESQKDIPTKPASPLLTSVLEEKELIDRAEAAVLHLSEVVSDPNLKAEEGELSRLPSQQLIVAALKDLDKLCQDAHKELDSLTDQKGTVEQEEQDELNELQKAERERQKAEELEKNRLAMELKQAEENEKREELQTLLKEKEDFFTAAKKELFVSWDERLTTATEEASSKCKADLAASIEEAKEQMSKEVKKIEKDIAKAKSNADKQSEKVTNAEAQYRTLLEQEKEKPEEEDTEEPPTGDQQQIQSVIETIYAQNKRKAQEAYMMSTNMVTDPLLEPDTQFSHIKDPKYQKSFEEWSAATKRVSGLANALYTEPSSSPYFQHNERMYALLGASVKEVVRDQKRQVYAGWVELAEEYGVRKRLYEKQQRKIAKKAQRGSVTVSGRKSIMGGKESAGSNTGLDRETTLVESGGRSSSNPYRRARRGNEVRTEYEQEQIIAEIAAKEAMEKRITHGGSKIPRQMCHREREFTAHYFNTFTSHKVDDPMAEAEEEAMTNIWSDMEKSIFLDRFLQFPKDFRRIASFLRNKNTKDCVAYYYDSKQTIPYKGALKEHIMRRKRRGDYQIWDSSIQAVISSGGCVTAGNDTDRPVVFSLPSGDKTYRSRHLHPLKRRILDKINLEEAAAIAEEDDTEDDDRRSKSKKRSRDALFSLDRKHTKFLRIQSQESMSGVRTKPKQLSDDDEKMGTGSHHESPSTPGRKPPQKWTATEKKVFIETLSKHGRNWAVLEKAVGTKNINQIKNFYYDNKKGKKANREGTNSPKPSRESGTKESSKGSRSNNHSDSVRRDGKTKYLSETLETEAGLAAQFDNVESDGDRSGAASIPESLPPTLENVVSAFGTQHGSLPSIANQYETAESQEASNELLQHLMAQQVQQQQQQQQQPHPQLAQQLLQQLQQQQQQQHVPSVVEQLLNQHREQQQSNQLSLEEAHRLLQQQHHSQQAQQQQNILANLLHGGGYNPSSALLGGQSGLSQQTLAAFLQQEQQQQGVGGVDIADLQRVLQLQQQATQNPLFGNMGQQQQQQQSALASLLMGTAPSAAGGSSSGLNSSAGVSPSLLAQLEGMNGQVDNSSALAEQLSALAGAHGILGFGGAAGGTASGAANALYGRQQQQQQQQADNAGVSNALSLLQQAMAHRDNTNNGGSAGFGAPGDGTDQQRYN